MKLFSKIVSSSKDMFSRKSLAKKLVATGIATAVMTAITLMIATDRGKGLLHIPAPQESQEAIAENVEPLPRGLSRERKDFEKAISILAEAKENSDYLEDYFERLTRRVKGETVVAEKGSGVRAIKTRRVTKLSAPEVASAPQASSEEMKGYAGSGMVAEAQAGAATASSAQSGSTGAIPQAGAQAFGELEQLTVGDMAFEMNAAIQRWVNWYTNTQGGRATMTIGLRRSQAYIDLAREEFRRAGVPEDLIWLALVESVWNPTAVSPAAAGGIWQFIPKTATEYGLTVQQDNDERTDPRKQTRVAAEYLRDLYTIFGDWALAMAAYNTGEPRVMDAIVKNGRANFWELYEKQLIPKETRDYVPKILAAIKVVSDADVYGFATGSSPSSQTEVTFGGH